MTPFAQPLPLGAIQPMGWLRRQLATQASGLSGALHTFWPDIRDSQWRGGAAEGWERVPYWLDGFLPLAALLGDDALLGTAREWIEIILAGQHDDGWFGPIDANESHGNRQRDPWPQFILFKVLIQWEQLTGDPRVVPSMLRAAERIHTLIAAQPLQDWAKMRWMELALSVRWLQERSTAPWLDALQTQLAAQGYDWQAHFAHFAHTERATRWTLENHVVNHGMALKEPLFRPGASADDLRRALAQLALYHGQANGMFSGDESLAGLAPSQGTELCAVVEALYSLELAYAAYGFAWLSDHVECIAYNALPATFTKDMWAHQYDQQVNQVLCADTGTKEQAIYTTNGPRSNLFGLEPNFGCCTANFHQGWPKLTSHLWAGHPDGSLAALAYAPCTISTPRAQVTVTTDYPFDETITVTGSATLHLPIPAWAHGATVNGTPVTAGTTVTATITPETPLTLHLPFTPRVLRRPHGSVSVYAGPLLFGLAIGEEVRPDSPEPWADRQVFPTTPWNYALDTTAPLTLQRHALSDGSPFAGAAWTITATAHQVPEWQIERHAAGPLPPSPVAVTTPAETVTLVPYGSTLLRVAEFPKAG